MDQQIDTNVVRQPAAPERSADQQRAEYREVVQQFLKKTENQKRIKEMIGNRQKRLNVNIDEVRQFKPDLAGFIVRSPIEAIQMFEDLLNLEITDAQGNAGQQSEKQQTDTKFPTKVAHYYVNFEGNIGKNYVTPRGLKSTLVNKFVQVQGIVTRMSIVSPQLQTSVHYCEATKRGTVKHYRDKHDLAALADTAAAGTEENNAFPTKD